MTQNPPSGFLNINKPKNITSHDVIDELRKITGIRKVGHAGTLDPFATGVLVIGINKATRLLEFIETSSKVYLATIKLGQTSNTYDRTGKTSSSFFKTQPTKPDIKKSLEKFKGHIKQKPPIYSAIKIAGKKLYNLARSAEEKDKQPDIKIPEREVFVKSIDIEDYDFPLLTARITSGKGVYIRSLAHDLGQDLKTGALLQELHREAVGRFKIANSTELQKLTPNNWQTKLLPLQSATKDLPPVTISKEEEHRITNGLSIQTKQTGLPPKQPLALLNQAFNLIAIATFDPTTAPIKPKKVLA